MFGMPDVSFINAARTTRFQGDQIRGFGFLHDGSIDTVFRFLQATVFNNGNLAAGFAGSAERRREACGATSSSSCSPSTPTSRRSSASR